MYSVFINSSKNIQRELNNNKLKYVKIAERVSFDYSYGYIVKYNKLENTYLLLDLGVRVQMYLKFENLNHSFDEQKLQHYIDVFGLVLYEDDDTAEYNLFKTLYDNNGTLPQINDWEIYQQLTLK